jgi:hypothetical protein
LGLARRDAVERLLVLGLARVHTGFSLVGLGDRLPDFDLIVALADARQHRAGGDAVAFL